MHYVFVAYCFPLWCILVCVSLFLADKFFFVLHFLPSCIHGSSDLIRFDSSLCFVGALSAREHNEFSSSMVTSTGEKRPGSL